MHKPAYTAYLEADAVSGSGKSSSYIKALDLLGQMLSIKSFGFDDCVPIWNVNDLDRLQDLLDVVREETRCSEASPWKADNIAPSYLENGYCRAALRSYMEFLVEETHSKRAQKEMEIYSGDPEKLAGRLNQAPKIPERMLEDMIQQEGKSAKRIVETRINQKVFRKIILQIYRNTCCISELDIPTVNRASHIIPWSENEKTRMDPRNGLCLSATYDAAFDAHLISLDTDYQIVLSKEIHEHYSSESVKRWFHDIEGQQIQLPDVFLPSQEYLDEHRKVTSY